MLQFMHTYVYNSIYYDIDISGKTYNMELETFIATISFTIIENIFSFYNCI
jgi:hypothetical protein